MPASGCSSGQMLLPSSRSSQSLLLSNGGEECQAHFHANAAPTEAWGPHRIANISSLPGSAACRSSPCRQAPAPLPPPRPHNRVPRPRSICQGAGTGHRTRLARCGMRCSNSSYLSIHLPVCPPPPSADKTLICGAGEGGVCVWGGAPKFTLSLDVI